MLILCITKASCIKICKTMAVAVQTTRKIISITTKIRSGGQKVKTEAAFDLMISVMVSKKEKTLSDTEKMVNLSKSFYRTFPEFFNKNSRCNYMYFMEKEDFPKHEIGPLLCNEL